MIRIIKESGETENFDEEKLIRSLVSAGAPASLRQDVVSHVTKDIREGMSTEDIYQHAFELLKKQHSPFAAQYSLRRAILQLGPSGFPFEKFIARILTAMGYTTQVGQMVRGACVEHEVDVIAEKGDERILVEAKFHNAPGVKTDVKVALYVDARFRDIHKKREAEGEEKFQRAWLITNTSFTSNAIQYGKCAGLLMTGWNYPKGRTLQDLIQESRVHPVTCLTTLSDANKQQLLTTGTVLCKDILERTDRLRELGLSEQKIRSVLEEGGALCTP